jgi:hypothetical protein
VRNSAGKIVANDQSYSIRRSQGSGSSPWYCHQSPTRSAPPRQKRGALYPSKSHQQTIEASATSTSSARALVR